MRQALPPVTLWRERECGARPTVAQARAGEVRNGAARALMADLPGRWRFCVEVHASTMKPPMPGRRRCRAHASCACSGSASAIEPGRRLLPNGLDEVRVYAKRNQRLSVDRALGWQCSGGTEIAKSPANMVAQVLPLTSRVSVDELDFDRVTMKEAVRRIVRMAKRRDRARYVCTGNLDHLVIADRDPDFRAAYRKADLVVADGAPVVWLSRLASRAASGTLPERVAGSDLFWELARLSGEANLRMFFLGGLPGAAARAAAVVEKRHPGARIAGTYCPPSEAFDTSEEQARIRRIVRQAAPDVLFVGFGAPKQEKWMAENKDLLGVPVAIGVGGSFELASGIRRRAPRWLRSSGLEWVFRFAQEPKRLFRRYVVDDLPYLAGAAARALAARFRGPARLAV